MSAELRIFEDPPTAARAAGDDLVRRCRAVLQRQDRFSIALAGGSTPIHMYKYLVTPGVRERVPWGRVDFLFGDERNVAPTHDDSNYRMARRVLLDLLPISDQQVLRMPANEVDLEAAALKYERQLRSRMGGAGEGVPVIDVVLLGMGADGHTASLFPHTRALHEQQRLVVANEVPQLQTRRMTMTYRIIQAAREVWFLVAGDDKAHRLREVLHGRLDYDALPAQYLARGSRRTVWYTDKAAASWCGDHATGVAYEAATEMGHKFQWVSQAAGHTNDSQLQAIVDSSFDDCLAKLVTTGCWGRANQVPSSVLWETAGDWLRVGQLQRRAKEKPRGYAGDDIMLGWICHQYRSDHPVGKLFDDYFQRQDAPQAVRGRTQYVADALVVRVRRAAGAGVVVSCVGAGPAWELELALRELTPSERAVLRIQLMDMEPEALERASDRLHQYLSANQIGTARINLARLRRPGMAERLMARTDFCICLGLFDYFEDAEAVATLRALRQRLSGGGELIVGNFSPQCQARAYMEWIGNWYLRYRELDEFQLLAADAGLAPERCQFGAESTGVDLLLHFRERENAV
ncbi:MAG: 6-phosphogluconolactonase [Pirellulaceae bacterium]|nr:6-phosphogluconolactonase [Planctomycetales bacterium]